MGIFAAEVKKRTSEEDILTSRVFGTLEILDRRQFLIPILEQCKVRIGEEINPNQLVFSYWPTIGETIPDVTIKDKSILILVESKLGAPLDDGQLVKEYENGLKEQKNLWLITVSSDYSEPTEVLDKAKNTLIQKGITEPRIHWINWQEIYTLLHKNAKIGNDTEQKLVNDLLSLLKTKGLSVFAQFEREQLNIVSEYWPEIVNFIQECSAFFGTLFSRLHKMDITPLDDLRSGWRSSKLKYSAYWLPRWIAVRAWDNKWNVGDGSQCLIILISLSPFELVAGYHVNFWKNVKLPIMLAEAANKCALFEKLRTLNNCSVSCYDWDFRLIYRVAEHKLNEETFGLTTLQNAVNLNLIIGRVFNQDEMISPKLVDEVVGCLEKIRNIVNENNIYFSRKIIEDFIPSKEIETVEAERIPEEGELAEE